MKIRGRVGANQETVDLLIEDGRIVEIAAADLSQACDLGDVHLRLSAGFIDLQLNGYGGIDFNDTATTTEQIPTPGATLRKFRRVRPGMRRLRTPRVSPVRHRRLADRKIRTIRTVREEPHSVIPATRNARATV